MVFQKKDSSKYVLNKNMRYFDQEAIQKNGWLRLKKNALEFRKKLHEWGLQRITLMLVPHSGRDAWNFHISYYMMSFVALVAGITTVSALFTIVQHQQSARNQIRLIVENDVLEKKYDTVSQTVDNLSQYFSQFRLEIGGMTPATKDDQPEISLNDPELVISSQKGEPKEIAQLQRLEKELDVTKQKFARIAALVKENEKVLKEIPSIYPVATRARHTSKFGVRRNPFDNRGYEGHDGLDMATFPGTPIYAAADGVIVRRGVSGGYGNLLEIDHKYGFRTRYGHMQSFGAQAVQGATVKQGQIIGYVGATGRVTGYHLHYEVLVGGSRVDPEPFVLMLK
ncbi:MAG: M23 family metallopeptidase [Brevinema sp.]